MFDIGWQELFLIGLLALLVVGPKDLPRVLRTITGMVRKVKGMAREFQNGLDEVVRESELDDMRKQIESQGKDMSKEWVDQVDPSGDLTGSLDLAKEQLDLQATANAATRIDDDAAKPSPSADTEEKKG